MFLPVNCTRKIADVNLSFIVLLLLYDVAR